MTEVIVYEMGMGVSKDTSETFI